MQSARLGDYTRKLITAALLLLCLAGQMLVASAIENKTKITRPRHAADLASLSTSLQEVVTHVSASVVQVSATGFNIEGASDSRQMKVFSRERGIGSGVVLSADGLIVTNAHVVEGAHRIRVHAKAAKTGEEGRASACRDDPARCREAVLEAKLVGVDRFSDLALLKVEATGLEYLNIRDSDDLHQGELVLALGSPLGLENSVSMGIVSSVARQLARDDPHVYIQTDAAINPGNSGGPLVDTHGRLVGINTFIMSQSGGSEGVGFAVPGDLVQNVVAQLRAQGRVRRGQIGVFLKTLTPELATALALLKTLGVVIEDVTPGGPAERAGLRIGDIVETFAGRPIQDVPQFAKALFQVRVGESAAIAVLRGANRIAANVMVEDRPHDPPGLADPVSENSVLPEAWGRGRNGEPASRPEPGAARPIRRRGRGADIRLDVCGRDSGARRRHSRRQQSRCRLSGRPAGVFNCHSQRCSARTPG